MESGNVELRDLDFIIPMQPETISHKAECIDFIRATIAEGDQVLAVEVQAIVKPCGGYGYADPGTI